MTRTVRALAAAGTAALALAPAAGAADYVGNQVIVKYAAGTSAAERGTAEDARRGHPKLNRVAGAGANVVRVKGTPQRPPPASTARPASSTPSRTTSCRPPRRPTTRASASCTASTTPTTPTSTAPEGWDIAFGAGAFPGTGVKVAIVDTGIDQAHEDLAGKTLDCAGVKSFGLGGLIGGDPTIVANKCTDDNDHGTHVAGTIGADANNGVGVAGVAPPAQFAICKALSSSGSGSTSGVANCIDWAARAASRSSRCRSAAGRRPRSRPRSARLQQRQRRADRRRGRQRRQRHAQLPGGVPRGGLGGGDGRQRRPGVVLERQR